MIMVKCGDGDLIGASSSADVCEGTDRPCSVAGLLLFGEGVNAYLVVCGEGVGYQWQRDSKLWMVRVVCR